MNGPAGNRPAPGIDRVQDRQLGRSVIRLMPGAVHVDEAPAVLTTVLGSCVAVCVRDEAAGIAGMNHFMLPTSEDADGGGRYGTAAMASLLETVRRRGGSSESLEVKVFGGGRIVEGMSDVGQRNIDFVRRWLAAAGLSISAEDLGGAHPRKIHYFVDSGRVLLRKLRPLHARAIAADEARGASMPA